MRDLGQPQGNICHMQKISGSLSWLGEFFPRGRENLRPIWIFITAALCLTGINFVAFAYRYEIAGPLLGSLYGPAGYDVAYRLFNHPDYKLHRLIYWSTWCCFFYLVVPACIVKLVWKEKLSDYGFKLRGALAGWPIYLCLLVIILPCVVLVSFGNNFQQEYPFYTVPRQEFMGRLLVWEIFYAAQFISLEFFFRGFMVHGLKPKLGIYSIFAMTLPYCMIHFTKPLPECLGSIIAGVVLGILSYRYRSIALGACIHICVAVSMDFLSLWHKGYF